MKGEGNKKKKGWSHESSRRVNKKKKREKVGGKKKKKNRGGERRRVQALARTRDQIGPGRGYGKMGTSPAPEEARDAWDHPPAAQRIWARLPVRRGGPGSSGLRAPSLFPLPGDREAELDTVGGCPQGRAPVRDCLGALGQAFQLAGPDLSGGLSSREINRGGGLQ